MAQHTTAEVMLVFPLDLRHRQKTVDQIRTPTGECVTRRRFILNDISTLEPPGAVHRRKPTAQVTHESEHAPDHRRSYFPHFVWTSTQALEHLADEFTMMPFLVFDLLDLPPLLAVDDRVPVTAIGITRRQLAGIGQLQRDY